MHLQIIPPFHSWKAAKLSEMVMSSSSTSTAVLLAVVLCYVVSAEIPNLRPGDAAPSFVLQVKRAGEQTEKLLKYKTGNDSNIQSPIIFLAFTNRSGFLDRLLSNPDSFNELFEKSPDNVSYVFLFYADYRISCNKDVRFADNLVKKFDTSLLAYHVKK